MDAINTIKTYFVDHQDEVRAKIIDLTREMVAEKTVNVATEKLNEHPYLKFRGEEPPVLGAASLNVGEIRGGVAPNVVPGS